MAGFKLPKETDEQKVTRSAAIQEATKGACEVPLEVMALAVQALEHAVAIAEKGNKNSVTDTAVGAMHLQTALKGAHLNVQINLPSIKDEAYVAAKKALASQLLTHGNSLVAAVEKLVEQAMA
jgi:formiminotetrahydrofolate cyclodeaminase